MKSNFYCLICFLAFIACHKDSETVIRDGDNPDPPVVIVSTRLVSLADTTFTGFDDATQTFSNQVVQFDQLPFQQVQGTGINRDYELVRLSLKEGFDLYQVQNLLENDINYLHWTHPDISHFSGNTSLTSTYTIAQGANLHIPANTLKEESGQVYQGTYDVYVASIEPNDEHAFAIPSYTGIDKHQQKTALTMAACYYVSVLTPDRQPLSFLNGALISNASSSGDAWYFDPQLSSWTFYRNDDISTTKEIPLEKCGYYAVAESAPLIRIEGTLKINASPVPHFPVSFQYDGQVRRVFTTNNGKWAIQVPAGIDITARIELPCDQVEEIILPITDAVEQVIPIDLQTGEIINAHITGTVRDCDGQPLSNHIILISSGNNQFLFQDQADLSFNMVACMGQMIGVRTLDVMNDQYGPEIVWPVAPTIDISSSFGCELAQVEYLLLNIEGNRKMYWDLQSAITPQDRLLIESGPAENELDFQLLITGMIEGTYEDTKLNIAFEDLALGGKGYSLYCPTSTAGCGFTDFTITHFPDQAGEWIRGRFKGNFWIKTFHPLTAGYREMEGEFQVYRDF